MNTFAVTHTRRVVEPAIKRFQTDDVISVCDVIVRIVAREFLTGSPDYCTSIRLSVGHVEDKWNSLMSCSGRILDPHLLLSQLG